MTPSDISRDLKVFADPATALLLNTASGEFRIQLTRDGQPRDYLFSKDNVVARHDDDRHYASFASLLASSDFADIRTFRATQRRLLEPKNLEELIPPEGLLVQGQQESVPLTLNSFRSAITVRETTNLAIVLLDGPAGVGKTSLIERMVFERSHPTSDQPPLLHVTSSGSRLTDLSKALAYATQILRSRVTFDQVPILVRLGVLQVAIDGFDELVDPEGYKDAWSALREFLGEIFVGGPVVLAGRDTFFDQQNFRRKLVDRITNLGLTSARLQPVSPNTAKTFLLERGWSTDNVRDAERQGWLTSGSYHLRPFFLAQIGTAAGWEELQESYGSPQAFLVRRFVTREAEIVSKMVDLSMERAEVALWDFYGLIAEDMASLELDTVDESFLALACETAFESFVQKEDLAKLMHKAGSFGLLESSGQEQMRRFPHSELQNQFLARVVVRSLGASSAVSTFLRRGLVSVGLIEAFGDVFGALAIDEATAVVNQLLALISNEALSDRLVSNVGALLMVTTAREDMPSSLAMSSISINEARVVGTLAPAVLTDLSIAHLDARGANCRLVEFIGCSASILTVDDSTLFSVLRPSVLVSMQISRGGNVEVVRVPAQIDAWLDAHTEWPELGGVERELPLVRYFDRVCRRFARQHQIRGSSNDEAYFLLKDPMWDEIKVILGDRLQADTRDARGPRNVFYRIIRPEALLDPQTPDEEAREIRRRVAARAWELIMERAL